MTSKHTHRALGTKEYRLTITADGETRTHTFLGQNEDDVWDQITATIEVPENPEAQVTLELVAE